MAIDNFKKELLSEKNLLFCDDETLKYAQKPIGKALLRGRPKKNDDEKSDPTDKITCEICAKVFVRSNRTNHKKTSYHQLYEKINRKMAKLIINDD